ncbi:MAG: hypothetical protein K2Q20_06390 [Phycisphaerales bacterium]|nr:hypothetical protein [Phycisphaerales bacterium]
MSPPSPADPPPPSCVPRCPACGSTPFRLIPVHGHSQCAACGCNVEPCCQPDAWPDQFETEPDDRTPSGESHPIRPA